MIKLIGQDISIVDSVIYDGVQSGIVLICSIYDCSSCLEKAFAEVREIDRIIKPSSVQIVGVLSDPTPLQTRFKYYDYIAYDADDLIRRRLKYIPTPVFVVCDENRTVRFVHTPTAEDSISIIAERVKNHMIRPHL